MPTQYLKLRAAGGSAKAVGVADAPFADVANTGDMPRVTDGSRDGTVRNSRVAAGSALHVSDAGGLKPDGRRELDTRDGWIDHIFIEANARDQRDQRQIAEHERVVAALDAALPGFWATLKPHLSAAVAVYNAKRADRGTLRELVAPGDVFAAQKDLPPAGSIAVKLDRERALLVVDCESAPEAFGLALQDRLVAVLDGGQAVPHDQLVRRILQPFFEAVT